MSFQWESYKSREWWGTDSWDWIYEICHLQAGDPGQPMVIQYESKCLKTRPKAEDEIRCLSSWKESRWTHSSFLLLHSICLEVEWTMPIHSGERSLLYRVLWLKCWSHWEAPLRHTQKLCLILGTLRPHQDHMVRLVLSNLKRCVHMHLFKPYLIFK